MSEHAEHRVSDWFARQLGCLWTPRQLVVKTTHDGNGGWFYLVKISRRGDLDGDWWEVCDIELDKPVYPPLD